jgi:hypothetical protein
MLSYIPLDRCPEVIQQDHMTVLSLVFKETSKLISIVTELIYIPEKRVKSSVPHTPQTHQHLLFVFLL